METSETSKENRKNGIDPGPRINPDAELIPPLQVLGFTRDGWRLPSNAADSFTEAQQGTETYGIIAHEMQKLFDLEQIKKDFKTLYAIAPMPEKDQLFQWGIVSPFLFVLRDLLGVTLHLVIQGPRGSGKGLSSQMIVNWFGGQRSSTSIGDLPSETRLYSVLSGSTFPVIIDDIQSTDLKEVLKGITSYYYSGESESEMKRVQFCAPLILNPKDDFAEFLLDDPALRERLFVIDLQPPSLEQGYGWLEAKHAIPRGGILAVLYATTREWNIKNITDLMRQVPLPQQIALLPLRKQLYYQVFVMAAILLKNIFDIKTDLTPVIAYLTAKQTPPLPPTSPKEPKSNFVSDFVAEMKRIYHFTEIQTEWAKFIQFLTDCGFQGDLKKEDVYLTNGGVYLSTNCIKIPMVSLYIPIVIKTSDPQQKVTGICDDVPAPIQALFTIRERYGFDLFVVPMKSDKSAVDEEKANVVDFSMVQYWLTFRQFPRFSLGIMAYDKEEGEE
jgi:hypothetical protein